MKNFLSNKTDECLKKFDEIMGIIKDTELIGIDDSKYKYCYHYYDGTSINIIFTDEDGDNVEIMYDCNEGKFNYNDFNLYHLTKESEKELNEIIRTFVKLSKIADSDLIGILK